MVKTIGGGIPRQASPTEAIEGKGLVLTKFQYRAKLKLQHVEQYPRGRLKYVKKIIDDKTDCDLR